jgi:hypothetical protein
MTQAAAPVLDVEAKLLGIMLSGLFVQTRPDCSEEERLRLELPPSGAYRIDARGVENTLEEPDRPRCGRGPDTP